MIRAIMAIDEEGGVSKLGTMPWPKNIEDMRWFKSNTVNNLVIMGKLTWIDPNMPTPLKDRVNVLVTSEKTSLHPGADRYISGDLINEIGIHTYPRTFGTGSSVSIINIIRTIRDMIILYFKLCLKKKSHH